MRSCRSDIRWAASDQCAVYRLRRSSTKISGLAPTAISEMRHVLFLANVFVILIWSPCAIPPSQDVEVGTTTLPGVRDCPIEGANRPLVVISHGKGGSFFGHRDTAETLADAGFIVA